MKNIFSIIAILFSYVAFSQVIVGDNIGTSTDKTSVLLEFASGQNKGIILPYVRTIPSGAGLVEGTLILDATDPTKAKVKLYKGNPNWTDLSGGGEADISTIMSSQPSAPNVTEDTTSKAIIGDTSTTADGVLVLESTNKAMVLPMVNSTDDIVNPAPGMLVYINKTGAKRLAVFNGEGWTYWKP